jgi:AAA family ATP:ADP antiporter
MEVGSQSVRMRLARAIVPGIQPQERSETLWAAGTILLVLVAHSILETSRDALFLAQIKTTRLPWMYLILAAFTLFASRFLGHSRGPRSDLVRLIFIQLGAALGTAAFLVLLITRPPWWTIYGLYVWSGFVSVLILIRFWLLLAGRFTASQAKRLFPVIAAGPVAGSLIGYGLAGLLSRTLPPQDLLAASAGFFFLSAGGSFVMWRAHAERQGRAASDDPSEIEARQATSGPPEKASYRRALRECLQHPYVRRVALLLLLATATITISDFAFKSVVARSVAPARLGTFLATVYLAFEVASLALLLTLVSRVVRLIGVTGALAVQPALMLCGGALLASVGGLGAVLCLRGVDGSLRWSLQKTAAELLYVPMAPRLRGIFKEVGDIVALRGGQALGSLLILAGLRLAHSEQWEGPLVVVLSAAWLWVGIRLRQPYLDLFRETLGRGSIARRLEFPDLDMGSLETLIAALNSTDDRRVIASMDLLCQTDRVQLVPALILYHPSPAVVVHALEVFTAAGREDFLPIAERLFEHHDAAVRAAAVRAHGRAGPGRAKMERAAASACPVVSTTAVAVLAARGWMAAEEALPRLERAVEEGDAEVWRSVACVLRNQPSAALAPLLIRLAGHPDRATQREAVAAMGAARDGRYSGVLIRLLAARELRSAARDGLIALGAPALAELRDALADPSLPRGVRVHLPRTISRFASQQAAGMLLEHLAAEPSGLVRYKILRALGRMVADRPEIELDATMLDEAVARQLETVLRQLHWRIVMRQGVEQEPQRRTTGYELLLGLLREKEHLALERLFRALGLRYRRENLARIYDGLRSAEAATRSSSLELLQITLPIKLGAAVTALVDDLPDEDRLAAGKAFYAPEAVDYETMLAMLIGETSVTLSALASYHAEEIGLGSPRWQRPSNAGREGGTLDLLRRSLTPAPGGLGA